MSRKGNCWDNAVAESFFKTLETEQIYRNTFTSKEQLEMIYLNFEIGTTENKVLYFRL
jgi:transposase InsO family protein